MRSAVYIYINGIPFTHYIILLPKRHIIDDCDIIKIGIPPTPQWITKAPKLSVGVTGHHATLKRIGKVKGSA